MIHVLEFPPKESLSKNVSFDSLYRMYFFPRHLLFFSAKSFMTELKVLRLLLIFYASLACQPVAPVSLSLSLPAKSTILNLEVLIICSPEINVLVLLIIAVNTACDLELSWFILVEEVCLFFNPILIILATSYIEVTFSILQPTGKTTLFAFSLRLT